MLATALVISGCASSSSSTSSTDSASATSGATGSVAPGAVGPPLPGVTDATAAVAGVSEVAPIDLTKKPVMAVKGTGKPSSLQVADVVIGGGASASATSTVSVQYLGLNYADGAEFDSSWASGQPASFSLASVVPGFTQGIGGTTGVKPMKVGGRRIIIVPSALGYGTTSPSGGPIQPNEDLIFVVDLLSVS